MLQRRTSSVDEEYLTTSFRQGDTGAQRKWGLVVSLSGPHSMFSVLSTPLCLVRYTAVSIIGRFH